MRTLLLIAACSVACFAQTQRSVVLAWNHEDPLVSFNIYRADGACATPGAFALIGSTDAGVLTYTDTDVIVATYCYRVTATLDGMESDPSTSTQAVIRRIKSKTGGKSSLSGKRNL